MKNFVFLSPNFPTNYWQFCRELKNNGLNVLGIGDQPYDELSPQLKDSLNEYYKVSSLENYDEVYRAVAFFIFRYGRIDWLESNNEYWLERDARLRTDFHIESGFQSQDMERIKYKGNYWSWDPKETWAVITWMGYLIYIHLRLFGRVGSKSLYVLLIFSFLALQMCWYGVNYLPAAQQSIHLYNRNN